MSAISCADGETAVDRRHAERDTKRHLLTRIAGDVDWLVKEQTGSFLDKDELAEPIDLAAAAGVGSRPFGLSSSAPR